MLRRWLLNKGIKYEGEVKEPDGRVVLHFTVRPWYKWFLGLTGLAGDALRRLFRRGHRG